MRDNRPKAVGELSPSQLLFTYGIGNIVDLPHFSALVLGLDDWPSRADNMPIIVEDRLLIAVRRELGPQVAHLRSLPISDDSDLGLHNPFDSQPPSGVPVAPFPRWLLCPSCRTLASIDSGNFSLKHDPTHPDRTHYVHTSCLRSTNGKPPVVVPARFLVACEQGHLDDFPWIDFVHRGMPCEPAKLNLLEYGPSGEARDLVVECETCNQRRRMAEAFGKEGREHLPACSGRRPHLRDHDPAGCDVPHMRAVILGASNLWFPVVYSTLAIPTTEDRLAVLIENNWPTLERVSGVTELESLLKFGMLAPLAGFSTAEVWAATQRKRQGGASDDAADADSVKAPEWRAFSSPASAPQGDDFRLREEPVPARFAPYIERVVLAERLREARAFAGFTRLDAPGELADMDIEAVGEQIGAISRQAPTWVPASELRGEGIFIQFREDAIQAWLQRPAVREWSNAFLDAHQAWRQSRNLADAMHGWPHLRYVLLHTFSHVLMRQVALECGYAQASVRERIYSREPGEAHGPMAGVLIYTSAPDSEGTLGGLVRLGRRDELERHLIGALESAELCSSDPTCAEHDPRMSTNALHGAACHSCLFAPETSCERGNRYLDRSVLVSTLNSNDRTFFKLDSLA